MNQICLNTTRLYPVHLLSISLLVTTLVLTLIDHRVIFLRDARKFVLNIQFKTNIQYISNHSKTLLPHLILKAQHAT